MWMKTNYKKTFVGMQTRESAGSPWQSISGCNGQGATLSFFPRCKARLLAGRPMAVA